MTTVPMTIQERVPMPVSPSVRTGGGTPAFSVGDLVRILKQWIFWILFIWFFIIAATAALTWYLWENHKSWRAHAFVLVESPFPKVPFQFGDRTIHVDLMDRFVADQIVLVKDHGVLTSVVMESPDVAETAWYNSVSEAEREQLIDDLREELSVRQIAGTNYMQISFSTRRREDAPIIVNTVVEKYIGRVTANTRDEYASELSDYAREEEVLKGQLDSLRERKLRFLASEIGFPGATEGVNIVGEMWRQLATQVAQLESEKLQYHAWYENLVAVDQDQLAISPQMRLMIQQDPQIQGLQNMLLDLDNQRQFLLRHFGPGHRSVRNIDAQIEVIENKRDQLLAERESQVREYELNSTQTLYLNATAAEHALRERAQEYQAQQRDLDRHLAEFRIQEEEQRLLEQQLNELRAYTNQLNLMIRDRGMVRVRSEGQAQMPLRPHFPRPEVFLPVGVVLGLMLGVGFAVLCELVDTSIRTSRDVTQRIHVPILGTIPDLDDEEVEIEQIETAAHAVPRSIIAEAFRTVRTNLLLSSPAERQRSLLVTSPRPEEGKTTVATNLAISIGQSGRRVLLVDANFHRPALQGLFSNTGREGLSNILIGRGTVEQLATSTRLPNVDVLPSGPIPPNPAELLASPDFRDFISQAVDRYDQVIVDAPPVLLVSDASVMTGVVDGVILVCRARKTSRGVLQRAREQVERVNGRIFGVVLNGARVSRGGYFREQIRTYYDYQPEDVLSGGGARALPHDEPSGDDAGRSSSST